MTGNEDEHPSNNNTQVTPEVLENMQEQPMGNMAGSENEEQIGRDDNNRAEEEVGEGSDDEDNEPYTMDEDSECSPCIPMAQFYGTNNPMGFIHCENMHGELHLMPRANTPSTRSIVHYIILDSPETSTRFRYGTCSRYNCYQARKKLLET